LITDVVETTERSYQSRLGSGAAVDVALLCQQVVKQSYHDFTTYILLCLPLLHFFLDLACCNITPTMATVNISDVDQVQAAYDSIVALQSNWLLLRYGVENTDDLFLYASGSQGLPELKQAFEDLSVVHLAFYREENLQVPAKPGFALINYIPSSISGVRRARALVQSRRVGALFYKASA
jgi:hypothetical protein